MVIRRLHDRDPKVYRFLTFLKLQWENTRRFQLAVQEIKRFFCCPNFSLLVGTTEENNDHEKRIPENNEFLFLR